MDTASFEELLRHGETPSVDFKGPQAFEGDSRPHLTATIAAMANSQDGGTIVVGVEESDGGRESVGLTSEQLDSFDTTRLGNYFRGKLSPLPTVRTEVVSAGGARCLAIYVQEFDDVPIVVTATLQSSTKQFAREGDILIRNRAAETVRISSAEDMRSLIGRALRRKGEDLLTDIRAILSGSPPPPLAQPEDPFAEEIPSWEETHRTFANDFGQYVRWTLRILPEPLLAPVPPQAVQKAVEQSVVRLRGWYFPHIPDEGLTFRAGHFTTTLDWQEHHERLAASYRGAFAHTSLVWSELTAADRVHNQPPPPHRPIDFLAVIWDVTERLRFTTTFLETLGALGAWVCLDFEGIGGRHLGRLNPNWFPDTHVRRSEEGSIRLQRTLTTAELKAGWQEQARRWTLGIFTIFQTLDYPEEQLVKDQERLLQRRS